MMRDTVIKLKRKGNPFFSTRSSERPSHPDLRFSVGDRFDGWGVGTSAIFQSGTAVEERGLGNMRVAIRHVGKGHTDPAIPIRLPRCHNKLSLLSTGSRTTGS